MEESSKTLAIDLSGQVLRGDLSFDQALLVAHTSKVVSVFVSCLNSFGGGDYFDISEAEDRIRSGDAQQAVDGKIPLFELPPELQGNVYEKRMAEHTEAERNQVESELDGMDSQAGRQEEILRECEEEIARLEAAERNRPSGPNPWIGSALVLTATFIICLFVLVSSKSTTTSLVFFFVGILVTGIVLTNDLTKLRKFLRREKRDSWKRMDRVKKNLKQSNKLQVDIESLRNQGEKVLGNAQMISEEDILEIRSSYPHLFPAGSEE